MSRFEEPQDEAFRALNDSISFDIRLGPYDVEQSRAHATMLAARGIISESERDQLHRGLEQVAHELGRGSFPVSPDDEDIHMAIERRVTEITGPVVLNRPLVRRSRSGSSFHATFSASQRPALVVENRPTARYRRPRR